MNVLPIGVFFLIIALLVGVIFVGTWSKQFQVRAEEQQAYKEMCSEQTTICEPPGLIEEFYLTFRYIGISIYNWANPSDPAEMFINDYYSLEE